MACTRYITQIQELVDGTLGAIRRAELEMHLEQCEDCRALLDDLRRIHDAAGSLEELQPPDRVWLQIAGRLRQEGRLAETAPSARGLSSRVSPSTWLRAGRSHVALAVAAALVIAVGASLMLLWPRTETPRAPAQTTASAPRSSNPTAATSVEDVENELRQAEQHYETAIARLQQIANSDQQALDPQVAATLQKNVQVIDQAIAESRAALRSEPTNVPARESLFEALRQKVTMLQNTIALMNEMRKGNSAGAAQVLNKS
jgi:anti-sigma factor RsiW